MMKNILIIQGHPDGYEPHFCHALACAYSKGAREAGHTVELINLGQLDIPLLRSKKEWENDSVPPFATEGQRAIETADHLVFIYPLWLGTMPAVLKAWLEHVLRPSFAFDVHEKGWTSRLTGRSARVVVTMGMPGFAYRLYFLAHSLKSFQRNILKFSGIKPVRNDLVGSIEAQSRSNRKKWLKRMVENGRKAI